MARTGVVDIRQAIKSQFTVALEAFRSRPAMNLPVRLISWVRAHGIGQAVPACDFLKRGENKSIEQAVAKGLMEVAYFPEFSLDVTVVDLVLVQLQRLRGGIA